MTTIDITNVSDAVLDAILTGTGFGELSIHELRQYGEATGMDVTLWIKDALVEEALNRPARAPRPFDLDAAMARDDREYWGEGGDPR